MRTKAGTVARMGGDEFAVILPLVNDLVHSGKVAENIIQKLSQPFTIDGTVMNISASIGIANYPEDGDSAEQLLKSADSAMYIAKDAGRGQFSYCIAS